MGVKVWFVVVVMTGVLAADTSASTDAGADGYIAECQGRPRYTFFTSGNKLVGTRSDKFCNPDEINGGNDTFGRLGSCDWMGYAESIVLTPALAFVVALASLVCAAMFWVCRICTCGGYHASVGMCSPDRDLWDPDEDGYTKQQILKLRIVVVVVAVLVVPFFVVGLMGTSQAMSALSNATDDVMGTAARVMDVLRKVDGQFRDLDARGIRVFAGDVLPKLQDAIATGNTIYTQADGVYNDTVKYGAMLEGVMYGSVIVPLVLCICCVFGAFLMVPGLAWPLAALGMLCMAVSWLLFGIFFPVSTAVADACAMMNGAEAADETAFRVYFSCDANVSALEELRRQVIDGVDDGYFEMCETFNWACTSGVFPCDSNGDNMVRQNEVCPVVSCPAVLPAPSSCGPDTFAAMWKDAMIHDLRLGCGLRTNLPDPLLFFPPGTPCPGNPLNVTNPSCTDPLMAAPCMASRWPWMTPENCSVSCVNPIAKGIAKTVYDATVRIELFNNILAFDIKPLVNCHTVVDLYRRTHSSLCSSLLLATRPILAAEGGIGILLLPAVVVAILGTKRFSKHNALDPDSDSKHKHKHKHLSPAPELVTSLTPSMSLDQTIASPHPRSDTPKTSPAPDSDRALSLSSALEHLSRQVTITPPPPLLQTPEAQPLAFSNILDDAPKEGRADIPLTDICHPAPTSQ